MALAAPYSNSDAGRYTAHASQVSRLKTRCIDDATGLCDVQIIPCEHQAPPRRISNFPNAAASGRPLACFFRTM